MKNNKDRKKNSTLLETGQDLTEPCADKKMSCWVLFFSLYEWVWRGWYTVQGVLQWAASGLWRDQLSVGEASADATTWCRSAEHAGTQDSMVDYWVLQSLLGHLSKLFFRCFFNESMALGLLPLFFRRAVIANLQDIKNWHSVSLCTAKKKSCPRP